MPSAQLTEIATPESIATFAFLHGGGQGSWVWNETLAALRLQSGGLSRAIALDVPGCGEKRGRDTTGIDVDDIVDELLADLSRAGMKDVVLVGHSQAGNILPRLAERRPDMFRRLIYISCSSPLPGQTVMQMMGKSRHGENENEVGWPFDPNAAQDMRERYPLMFCNDMRPDQARAFLARLGNDTWPSASYAATDWRYDHLGAIPSTYVVCLKDGVLPVAWQEKFAARFQVQRLVRIDAGHQVMNTRPHTLAEVLRHEAGET
jgi:pimeloyl-ACP methyl ester carboxylesterase